MVEVLWRNLYIIKKKKGEGKIYLSWLLIKHNYTFTFFSSLKKYRYLCVYVCVGGVCACVLPCECRYRQRPEEGTRFLGSEVAGGCEPCLLKSVILYTLGHLAISPGPLIS